MLNKFKFCSLILWECKFCTEPAPELVEFNCSPAPNFRPIRPPYGRAGLEPAPTSPEACLNEPEGEVADADFEVLISFPEIVFSGATLRTNPVRGNTFPRSSRIYAIFVIAFLWVINVSTRTFPFLHDFSPLSTEYISGHKNNRDDCCRQ